MASQPSRVLEIDVLRGFAIILMIGFHITFDLQNLAQVSLNLPYIYWRLMPEFIGSLFFSLVGLSAWIKYKTNQARFSKDLIRRGLFLLLIALIISLISYFFNPHNVIYFGVLHCIGTSLLLLPLWANQTRWISFWGITFICLGIFLWQFKVSFPYFIWLGLAPESGTGGDWFSLFPYLGVVLLGYRIGQFIYPFEKPNHTLLISSFWKHSIFRGLGFLGRYSLLIYLIHQPILIGIISQLKMPS